MIFCFERNIAFCEIRGCCRQIWQKFFCVFGLKFEIFLFWKKLCIWRNFRVLISNMTIFFKIAAQKMLIESIFSAKYLDLYFCTKLCFDIFGSANLKYGNRFLKLQPKNSSARPFLSQSWKLLAFRETLQFKMFESAGIK